VVALTPQAEYDQRLARWLAAETQEDRGYTRVSDLRLLVAIGAAILAYLVFGPVVVSAYWLLLPLIAFVALMLLHIRIDKRRRFAQRGVRYYRQGLARISDKWAGTANAGDRYADSNHPYANDLDLFGRGSLFELVSTARTEQGESTLASWLTAPAPSEEARRRQDAVRELTPNLDLREMLMLLGEEIRSEANTESLTAWAGAPDVAYFR
jgi:hypothetical protein